TRSRERHADIFGIALLPAKAATAALAAAAAAKAATTATATTAAAATKTATAAAPTAAAAGGAKALGRDALQALDECIGVNSEGARVEGWGFRGLERQDDRVILDGIFDRTIGYFGDRIQGLSQTNRCER